MFDPSDRNFEGEVASGINLSRFGKRAGLDYVGSDLREWYGVVI